jgi:SAM-dependent methyltransferase
MSVVATDTLATVETDHFGAIAVKHRDCPLCGRNNDAAPASAFSHAPWMIRTCSACGFVYIDHAPDYALQFETMAWERTTKVEEQRRAELRPISYKASKRTRFRMHILPKRTMVDVIARHCQGGKVLDLGCGSGQAMAAFPESFIPYGIEISSALASEAEQLFAARGGHAINAPSIEGLKRFPENFFVAASLRSYLEHEAEPLPVLEGLQRVLVPGGIAVVKVPNFGSLNRIVMGRRWCGFRYPDHLNYFTPASLAAMAAKAGFRTRFGAAGRLPTSDNMWAVLTKPAG